MASSVNPLSSLGMSSVVGTTFLDGIASGINTSEIITQLATIQSRPIVRLNAEKSKLSERLALYQSLNASLGALSLAAQKLGTPSEFTPNRVKLSGDFGNQAPMVVSAEAAAQQGTYQIAVNQLASAHKISSGVIASPSNALGYAGDFLINGHVVSLTATDTLATLRDKINDAHAGVVATILTVSETDHRLLLTAEETGAAHALDLVEANGSGVLEALGLVNGMVRVKHAIADGMQSDGIANSALEIAQALGLIIPPSGTVFINGQAVYIDLGADSLEEIKDKINAQFPVPEHPELSVTASIVSEEVGGATVYRLQLTGASGPPTLQDDNNVLQALGILTKDVAHEKQAARDAQITVDGITVTRSSNSVDDLISGVSMELTAATPNQTVTLSITPDLDAVVANVQSFVNAYNSVIGKLNEAMAYNTESKTGGLLLGDQTAYGLQRDLRAAVMAAVTVPGSSSAALSGIGISTDRYGKLVLNTTKLREALEEDRNAVANLFGLNVVTSSAQVQYVSSTRQTADSGPAGYAVHISQAATRGAGLSRTYGASEGISVTETLTFDEVYPITLTAGMTLEEARDQLNGWFQTYDLPYEASVVTEGEQRRLRVEHDYYGSQHSVTVSSSLDQGAGGTDLGGATHGVTATYTGKDVAGTIHGEPATGTGQYLTGLDNNATTAGLKLRITATQDNLNLGTITIAKGAARRIVDYVSFATDTSYGPMAKGAESISRSMKDIDKEIARVEQRVQRYVDQMRVKFARMEEALGRAQALQQYMTGQIASLAKLNRDR